MCTNPENRPPTTSAPFDSSDSARIRRAHYKVDLSSLLFNEQKTHLLTFEQHYTLQINYTTQINTSEETVCLFSLLTGDFVCGPEAK